LSGTATIIIFAVVFYVAASCFRDRNGDAFPPTGVAGLTISFHA